MGVLGVIRADLGYWKGMRGLGFYFGGGFRGIMGVLGGGLKVFWGEGVELSLGFWGGGIMGHLEAFGEFWDFLGGKNGRFLVTSRSSFWGAFREEKRWLWGRGFGGKKSILGSFGDQSFGGKSKDFGVRFLGSNGRFWVLLGSEAVILGAGFFG